MTDRAKFNARAHARKSFGIGMMFIVAALVLSWMILKGLQWLLT